MKNIEKKYEQFRNRQINGMKYKNDEFLIGYNCFLRRKGFDLTTRKQLINIRTNRLLAEAQATPMPPFTNMVTHVDKRVK